MSANGLLGAMENIEYSGIYLPAIGFGILSVNDVSSVDLQIPITDWQIGIYSALFVLSLVSAYLIEELVRSVSGPIQNEPNPTAQSKVIQRFAFTIFREGKPADYPTDPRTPIWQTDLPIPKRRYAVFAVLIVSFITITLIFPYSIFELIKYTYAQNSLLTGAIAFIHIFYASKIFKPDIFPNTYLFEAQREPSINARLEELAVYLRSSPLIRGVNGEYNTDNGGEIILQYETRATTSEEERQLLAYLLTGYAGIIISSEFPCRGFHQTVIEADEEVAEYYISANLIEKLRSDDASMDEVIHQLVSELEETESEITSCP